MKSKININRQNWSRWH